MRRGHPELSIVRKGGAVREAPLAPRMTAALEELRVVARLARGSFSTALLSPLTAWAPCVSPADRHDGHADSRTTCRHHDRRRQSLDRQVIYALASLLG